MLPNNLQPRLVSIKDTCGMLALSRTTVFRMVKADQLKTVQIRGRTLITAASIDELLADAEAA